MDALRTVREIISKNLGTGIGRVQIDSKLTEDLEVAWLDVRMAVDQLDALERGGVR